MWKFNPVCDISAEFKRTDCDRHTDQITNPIILHTFYFVVLMELSLLASF